MKTDVKGMLRNCSTNNIMVPIYPEKKNIHVQLEFAKITVSGYILGSNSEISNV